MVSLIIQLVAFVTLLITSASLYFARNKIYQAACKSDLPKRIQLVDVFGLVIASGLTLGSFAPSVPVAFGVMALIFIPLIWLDTTCDMSAAGIHHAVWRTILALVYMPAMCADIFVFLFFIMQLEAGVEIQGVVAIWVLIVANVVSMFVIQYSRPTWTVFT